MTDTQQEQRNTTSEKEETEGEEEAEATQTRETELVSQTQATANNAASPATTTKITTAALSSSPKKPSCPKYSYRFLMANACKRYNGERAVIGYLMEKKKNDAPGWLRRLEASILWESQNGTNNEATPAAAASPPPPEIDLTKHLTAMEKRRAMDLILLGKPDDRILTLVSYAFGVTRMTMSRLERSLLENPEASLERKTRSDRGQTIWNSDQKRNSLFTPQFVFSKKIRRLQPPPNGKAWTAKQIRRAWKKADPSVKEECARTAQEWKEKGSSMIEQVTQTLDENATAEIPQHPNEREKEAVGATNNSALSARQLAQQLTPTGVGDGSEVTMLSKTTVIQWVKALPDYNATYVHKERGWHYYSNSTGDGGRS